MTLKESNGNIKRDIVTLSLSCLRELEVFNQKLFSSQAPQRIQQYNHQTNAESQQFPTGQQNS